MLATLLISFGQTPAAGARNAQAILDPVVVTATTQEKSRRHATATVQVIDEEGIARSTANSLTGLLAENAAGFFSQWTPGQTSINIRGGASDGQGRDFRGQVLVLVNGRRAGTANLSKLSLRDVQRVEIVRGPASVLYGSQAMGGVINIILKNGHNSSGGLVDMRGGSWGLGEGHAGYAVQNADGTWSAYVGATGGRRDSYHAGGGARERNTQWERRGGSAALGWRINEDNLLDVNVRSDGVYDAGFRGSAANYFSTDDRYNRSADLSWQHGLSDDLFNLNLHTYLVRDVDDFHWASPNSARTGADYNKRTLDITGFQLRPLLRLLSGNELLLGVDGETSRLRSNRYRARLNGQPWPTNPLDNNQTEDVLGLYMEDSQRFLDDRLTLRGGLRYTYGRTTPDWTPNLSRQSLDSSSYQKTTWSLGANYLVNGSLSLRASAATGFRAPTATELTGDITYLAGTSSVGNPGLQPESSEQYEAGAMLVGSGWNFDAALFQNTIKNRITTKTRPGTNPAVSDYINNPGDILVRGLELQGVAFLEQWLPLGDFSWSLGANFTWNFDMKDKGVVNRNTDRPQRMYQTQGSLYTSIGQPSVSYPWSVRLSGVYSGPMWYDTEENLLIPEAEPNKTHIHQKSSFTVWNLRGEVEVASGWAIYAGINNLFDKNQHPIFIALDQKPYLMNPSGSNGGLGTSMAGREFYGGVKHFF